MLPAKYLNGNAVLAIPAYAVIRNKTNDESNLNNASNRKAKSNNNNSKNQTANSLELCGV